MRPDGNIFPLPGIGEGRFFRGTAFHEYFCGPRSGKHLATEGREDTNPEEAS
jgi:hypothetical protein